MTPLLLYGLAPLLIFAYIDSRSKDMRSAILAAVLAGAAELGYMYQSTGRVDSLSLVGMVLLLLLSLVSLRTQNRLWFKLQPAIIAFLVAGLLAYMQFFSQPVLERYWPLISAMLPPEQLELLTQSSVKGFVNRLFDWFVLVVLLDGVWIAYAAYRQSQRAWILVNVFGTYVLTALLVLGAFLYRVVGG